MLVQRGVRRCRSPGGPLDRHRATRSFGQKKTPLDAGPESGMMSTSD